MREIILLEQPMFKIGEFSRLSHISIKTLRYYDELGLFKPHHTDPVTGYRYYTAQQLSRLHQIMTLKDLGFSLESIGQWLNDELPAAEFGSLLREKYAELSNHLTAEQERLERIGAYLRRWERAPALPTGQVSVKTLEAQPVLSIRAVVPTYVQVGALFGELSTWMDHQHVAVAGAWFAIYHDAEYRPENPDVEAVIPAPILVDGTHRIRSRIEPRVQVVSCVHTGGYATINHAYATAAAWIETHGYRLCGLHREVYLRGADSGDDPSAFVTEVQFPVEQSR